MYSKFLVTPGVLFDQDGFVPKAAMEDASELIDDTGDGHISFALMGYDPDGERWEFLMHRYSASAIVRKARMMFGVALDGWDGSFPLEFEFELPKGGFHGH